MLREFAAAATQGARVETVRGQGGRFTGRADVLETVRGTLTSADLVACERSLIDLATGRASREVAQLDEQTRCRRDRDARSAVEPGAGRGGACGRDVG